MSAKYRNIFLGIGVMAIVIMLCTFEMSYAELWEKIRHAGGWFWAVVLLWIPIYMLNAWSWYVIINDGQEERRVGYWRVLKYTISGYALNYVTPVGVLGGEPYRILELTPYVGGPKASSSVILYAMMHIFSHFCFWAFAILLFLLLYIDWLTWGIGLMLVAISLFCALGIYFFMQGYRNGLAMRALQVFGKLPVVGVRIRAFATEHAADVEKVDCQIAALHAQRRATFYWSLALEFLARIVGCLEVLFILNMLPENEHAVSFSDCIIMQAFMSLFANLMFFIPMEMGTREGGFALVTGGLHMRQANGLLTGLVTRVRELIWIAIGLALMKIGNRGQNPATTSSRLGVQE